MKLRRDIIRKCVVAAGEVVKKAIPTQGIVKKEGRGNIVTADDLASQKVIVSTITSSFPSDAIVSEEISTEKRDILSLPHVWVIDPIDGTNNFRHERNYSCISVGYIERGIKILGAVYNPFRDDLILAEKGQGATNNGKRIQVGRENDIFTATVAADNSYDPEGTRQNLELFFTSPSKSDHTHKGKCGTGDV